MKEDLGAEEGALGGRERYLQIGIATIDSFSYTFHVRLQCLYY
jgi:hypothetical protein